MLEAFFIILLSSTLAILCLLYRKIFMFTEIRCAHCVEKENFLSGEKPNRCRYDRRRVVYQENIIITNTIVLHDGGACDLVRKNGGRAKRETRTSALNDDVSELAKVSCCRTVPLDMCAD